MTPGSSVQELKQRVAATRPDFPARRQKLLYAGEVLEDTVCLRELGLQPEHFLVVIAVPTRRKSSSLPSSVAAATPSTAAGHGAEAGAAISAAATSRQAPGAQLNGGASVHEREPSRDAARTGDAGRDSVGTDAPPSCSLSEPLLATSSASEATAGRAASTASTADTGMGIGSGCSLGPADSAAALACQAAASEIQSQDALQLDWDWEAVFAQLSPEELAAVDRLAGLGFSRKRAFEALLACGGDEEYAAGCLFDGSLPQTALPDGFEDDAAEEDVAVDEVDEAAVQRLVGLGFRPEDALAALASCGFDEELAAGLLFESPLR